jgi:hypothetical protein
MRVCVYVFVQDMQALMSVVTLHRIAFKSTAGLDRDSETYVAGVQALVDLYERVRDANPEVIGAIAPHTNTIITTLCSSTHRLVSSCAAARCDGVHSISNRPCVLPCCSAFGGSYHFNALTSRDSVASDGSSSPSVESMDAPFLVKIMSLIYEVRCVPRR